MLLKGFVPVRTGGILGTSMFSFFSRESDAVGK